MSRQLAARASAQIRVVVSLLLLVLISNPPQGGSVI
jgi:hypothetical protein